VSGTGKSCRTRSDIGLERVNGGPEMYICLLTVTSKYFYLLYTAIYVPENVTVIICAAVFIISHILKHIRPFQNTTNNTTYVTDSRIKI
jgi:hypothetical protein